MLTPPRHILRFVLLGLGGLALALAPAAPGNAQEDPPEGEPACTEPADPNTGPPEEPPEDTPLPAEPADPDDCPDDESAAAGAGDADNGTTDRDDSAEVAGATEGAAGGGGSGEAQAAGATETADADTPDELAFTGSLTQAALLLGIATIVIGSSSLAVRKRLV